MHRHDHQAFEPVTQDQAEVYEAERAARAVVRARRLREWAPRWSVARFVYWREQRAAEADVIAVARGLEQRAWERDVLARGDVRAVEEAHAAGYALRGF